MIGEMDVRQRTGLSFLFGNAYQVGRQHHLSLMSVQRLNSNWEAVRHCWSARSTKRTTR